MAAFPIDTCKKIILKRSQRHWQQFPNLFVAPLPLDVCSKYKATDRAMCAVGNQEPHWQQLYNVARNLQRASSHRMGEGEIFLKIFAPHPFKTNFLLIPISARSILLDSAFKYLFLVPDLTCILRNPRAQKSSFTVNNVTQIPNGRCKCIQFTSKQHCFHWDTLEKSSYDQSLNFKVKEEELRGILL